MQSTVDLLDAMRARCGSDRKAAGVLGVSQPTFSGWRLGHNSPSDDNGRQMAEFLGIDAAFVLAILHGDRAKSPETRAVWNQIAAAFGKAATVAGLAICAAAPAPAPAASLDISNSPGQGIHIMSRKARQRRNSGRSAFAAALAMIFPFRPAALL